MYVRWKKRAMTRTNRYRGRFSIGAHALSAVLVECRRFEGKPRQRFLAQLGTIEVGKDANLILVDENPLAGLATLRRPTGVMVNGRYAGEPVLEHVQLEEVTAHTSSNRVISSE